MDLCTWPVLLLMSTAEMRDQTRDKQGEGLVEGVGRAPGVLRWEGSGVTQFKVWGL